MTFALARLRPPFLSMATLPLLALALLPLSLFGVGCSEPTAPGDTPPGGETQIDFDGLWNDDGGEFLLQRVDQPGPDGRFYRVDLIGREVDVNASDEIVSVKVSLRNASNLPLYPPAIVRLHHFVPGTVRPLEGDLEVVPSDSTATALVHTAFADYSGLFGDDGVFSPDERSGELRWRFHVPGLSAFAFAAELNIALDPNTPSISGRVFNDTNRDGVLDPDETGFVGQVQVMRPDGSMRVATVDIDGFYSLPVKDPGLHEVTYIPPPTMAFAPLCFTTPNPLQVLLPPGPNGEPQSFAAAHFGIDPEPCLPNVQDVILTERDAGQIETDQYSLPEVVRIGRDRVRLKVGFSGCGPDHDFQLFAGANFMESNPVQTWVLLQHDAMGELCTAHFERDLYFDLKPIRDHHRELYGTDGPIKLIFLSMGGALHEILLD